MGLGPVLDTPTQLEGPEWDGSGNSNWNWLDYFANLGAGAGDGITGGLTDLVRSHYGTNDGIDKQSWTYFGAAAAGTANGVLLGGAVGLGARGNALVIQGAKGYLTATTVGGMGQAGYNVYRNQAIGFRDALAFAPAAGWGLGKAVGALRGASAASSALRAVPPPSDSGLRYLKPGSFSILDWRGYPSIRAALRPNGPFRILSGSEYKEARNAADKVNAALRKADPSKYAGKEIHEIHPIKFGGSPTDPANKIFIPRSQHNEFSGFWDALKWNLWRDGLK